MNFESPQREVVVSGHKYNMRALGLCNGTDDIEPRLSRHLNVEEHQVRPMPVNRVHSFSPIATLADKFQILAPLRERPEAASRKLLVISYYRANLHVCAASIVLAQGCMTGASRKGSLITTAHPVPPVLRPIVRLAAGPYNAFSRSEEFRSPVPKTISVAPLSPVPSSSTDTTNVVSSLCTDTHRVPPASRGSTPWRTAFSTSG